MDQWGSYNPSEILNNIFNQYNEHRILVPRIFFLIDLLFFYGKNGFLIFSIFICQIIHIGLFWWILGFSDSITKRQRITLTSMVSILLLSLTQHENFLWGFQIQFVGVFAAATAAFASIARLAEVSGGQTRNGEAKALLWLGSSIACLVLSILMMSNGLLAGLPLIVLAFWIRVPRLYLAIIVAVFLASAGIYLHGYHSPNGHAKPLESLAHIDGVLLYAAAYLGGPFGSILADVFRPVQPSYVQNGLLTAQVMGIFGLVISAALGLLVVSRGRDQTCRAEAVLLMILAMVVGTALVTALGRLNFTYAQALSSRYATPALIFWAATGLLGYLIAARLPPGIGRALSIAGVAVFAVLSTVVAPHQILVVRGLAETRLSRDQAGIAMILGVKDDETIKHIFPDPSLPWGARDFLRANRFSMFSEPFAKWYGVNIRDQFDVARKSRCQGFFDTVTGVISSGSEANSAQGRATGWVWDNEQASVPSTIVISDEKGVIVGLGLTGYRRPDVSKAIPEISSPHSGWQGLVNGVAGSSLTAYAVLDGGQMVCRLEQDHSAPLQLMTIDEGKATARISISDVDLDGMWQLDGDDHVNVPRPALDGPVYGSWNGSDVNVGRLTFTNIPIPPNRKVAIPFATGPVSSHLSLYIQNGEKTSTKRITVSSPMKWKFIIIDLPDNTDEKFNLIAEDIGAAWGEWLAIGAPRSFSSP